MRSAGGPCVDRRGVCTDRRCRCTDRRGPERGPPVFLPDRRPPTTGGRGPWWSVRGVSPVRTTSARRGSVRRPPWVRTTSAVRPYGGPPCVRTTSAVRPYGGPRRVPSGPRRPVRRAVPGRSRGGSRGARERSAHRPATGRPLPAARRPRDARHGAAFRGAVAAPGRVGPYARWRWAGPGPWSVCRLSSADRWSSRAGAAIEPPSSRLRAAVEPPGTGVRPSPPGGPVRSGWSGPVGAGPAEPGHHGGSTGGSSGGPCVVRALR